MGLAAFTNVKIARVPIYVPLTTYGDSQSTTFYQCNFPRLSTASSSLSSHIVGGGNALALYDCYTGTRRAIDVRIAHSHPIYIWGDYQNLWLRGTHVVAYGRAAQVQLAYGALRTVRDLNGKPEDYLQAEEISVVSAALFLHKDSMARVRLTSGTIALESLEEMKMQVSLSSGHHLVVIPHDTEMDMKSALTYFMDKYIDQQSKTNWNAKVLDPVSITLMRSSYPVTSFKFYSDYARPPQLGASFPDTQVITAIPEHAEVS